jgi:hypothetical protein
MHPLIFFGTAGLCHTDEDDTSQQECQVISAQPLWNLPQVRGEFFFSEGKSRVGVW